MTDTSGPISRRIELSTGLSYHLLEWGADQPTLSHTVVLVHGFLDLAWGWEDTVRAGLSGRAHVIAPDMRGHGDSDRVGAGGYYYFTDYVADLASVVDQLGRERVSLVGHSMGGGIVGYLAGAWPDRVHRLALLEGLGPPADDTPEPERVAHWIADWRRARTRQARGYASLDEAAKRLQQHDAALDPALALRIAERGTRRDTDGLLRFKHDPLHLTRGPYPFRLDAAEAFWRRIACPTLVVEGSESPFRHLAGLDERVACLRDARRVVIDGAGHMMQRHKPAELAARLVDHLGLI